MPNSGHQILSMILISTYLLQTVAFEQVDKRFDRTVKNECQPNLVVRISTKNVKIVIIDYKRILMLTRLNNNYRLLPNHLNLDRTTPNERDACPQLYADSFLKPKSLLFDEQKLSS